MRWLSIRDTKRDISRATRYDPLFSPSRGNTARTLFALDLRPQGSVQRTHDRLTAVCGSFEAELPKKAVGCVSTDCWPFVSPLLVVLETYPLYSRNCQRRGEHASRT